MEGVVMRGAFACLFLLAFAAPATAQDVDPGYSEIVVTGTRINLDGYSDRTPAVGLRRTADFAIQPISVTGDTRDAETRHSEMYQTIRRALELAPQYGVELAYGDPIVEPLTLANYEELSFQRDNRPDSDRIRILAKSRMGQGGNAKDATQKIDRFLKAIKPVGRALVEANGDMTLSIVAPDKYRGDINKLIADDAGQQAAKFGTDYGVEVEGLNRPVEWSRASLTEVFLYIPYKLTVVPKTPR